MRATLADASLARYAGRFVWLELDFDKPANQRFLLRHHVTYTPSFFILDPADERATATQLGGMTLPELSGFLERGERGVAAGAKTPADAALARGDALLGRGRTTEAAEAFHDALRIGGRTWPERERALGSLTWALMGSSQWKACAEASAWEAPRMKRGQMFARVVLSGLSCVNQEGAAIWAEPARRTLEPLAAEAIALPSTLRDHRFQLYQQLMSDAGQRGDRATVLRWGNRWLHELDASRPANDDERTALDVARVDAASLLGEPLRVLPALIASERAMPGNYNASLRLAQVAADAGRYDEALAACDRGLAHVSGPLGRTWLLRTKADAFRRKGKPADARWMLSEALRAAQTIGIREARQRNVDAILNALRAPEKGER